MSVPVVLVDAFADEPFRGNSAAVCPLVAPAESAWMQAVARELQQPATAFVWPAGDELGLRWFTASAELVLCGHGTLATAHVLWEAGRLPSDAPARFQTASGPLAASRDGDWIELDFPAEPARPAEAPPGLVEALGAEARAVARSRLDYLVEVATEGEILALRPDFTVLRQVETRGVIVTAPAAQPGYDVVSRFFAPSVGLEEDAVTGSAHCTLGPYWAARLGRSRLLAYQASARGGTVRVALDGARVRLAGRALTMLRGTLLPEPPPAR